MGIQQDAHPRLLPAFDFFGRKRLEESGGHFELAPELARRAFAALATSYPANSATPAPQVSDRLASYGIDPLPKRGGIVTNELIDRLRDAEGI